MATDQTARDLALQRERDKNFNAWALVVIGAIAVALAAIAVTVFLVTRDEEPAGPPPVDTAAEQAADEAAAIEAFESYTAASDAAYAANSAAGLEEFADPNFIASTVQTVIDNNIRGGYTTSGGREIVAVEPTLWEPNVVGGSTVTLAACVDISGVTTSDSAGNPVPSFNPDGTPLTRTRVPVEVVVRDNGGWRVYDTTPNPDLTAAC